MQNLGGQTKSIIIFSEVAYTFASILCLLGIWHNRQKVLATRFFLNWLFNFFLRQARWACVKRRSLCKHVAATTENRRKREPRRQHGQWRRKQRRWWIHDQIENSFGERRHDHLVSPMMAHDKVLLGLLRELIGDFFSKLSCNLVSTKRSHAPCYSIGIVRGWPTFLPAGYLSQ